MPQKKRSIDKETPAAKRGRVKRILKALHQEYPGANCALHHRSAFELLVSTILSAQSTDQTVNKVTPVLFARYRTPKEMGNATQEEIEKIIYTTGFFRQKAKSLREGAQTIVDQWDGEVPATMQGLLTLRGVARKTANVVLGTWFGLNEGIVVDTHVGRLAKRLGLAPTARDEKDAVRIEKNLSEVVAREEWTYFAHALIHHGRKVCVARKPNCPGCGIAKWCPSAGTFSNRNGVEKQPQT